jgi:hypothetical protein
LPYGSPSGGHRLLDFVWRDHFSLKQFWVSAGRDSGVSAPPQKVVAGKDTEAKLRSDGARRYSDEVIGFSESPERSATATSAKKTGEGFPSSGQDLLSSKL